MVEVGGSNPPGPTKHEALALAGVLFGPVLAGHVEHRHAAVFEP